MQCKCPPAGSKHLGSAAAFHNFILMGESAWQRRGRDRLPRTDTGAHSAATAQQHQLLVKKKGVLGKKKIIREEGSMRNKNEHA